MSLYNKIKGNPKDPTQAAIKTLQKGPAWFNAIEMQGKQAKFFDGTTLKGEIGYSGTYFYFWAQDEHAYILADKKVSIYAQNDDLSIISGTGSLSISATTGGITMYPGAANAVNVPSGGLQKGGVSVATMTVADTEVFNTTVTSAGTWQDLDLSGTVGTNTALVGLKVISDNNNQRSFAVRKNGDTDSFYHGTGGYLGGTQAFDISSNCHTVLTVATDSSGVVEIVHENNTDTITIDVMWYMK